MEKYFVVYNSIEDAHDFGMLTQRELSFEEAIKEIKEDVEDKKGKSFMADISIEEVYKKELNYLENYLEAELGNRFYRIVLINKNENKEAILEYTCKNCGHINKHQYINVDGEPPVINLDELEAFGLECSECGDHILLNTEIFED